MKMLENKIFVVKLVAIIISCIFLYSCSKDENTSKSGVTTQTVKKKILIAVPSSEQAEQSAPDKIKSAPIANITSDNKDKLTGESNDVKADDVSEIKQKLLSSVIKSDKIDNSIVKTNPDIEQYYNPDGKLDPFKSIFFEPEVADGEKFKPKKQTRKHITPLEKFDLGQLELVGVIKSDNEYIGLVEESNGKGHIVRLGTYIGLNSGRIVEILQDRLMIEEEVVNPLGKTKVIHREMKLQKPVGE